MKITITTIVFLALMVLGAIFYQPNSVGAATPSRTTEPGPFIPTVMITRPGSPTRTPTATAVSEEVGFYVYFPLIIR